MSDDAEHFEVLRRAKSDERSWYPDLWWKLPYDRLVTDEDVSPQGYLPPKDGLLEAQLASCFNRLESVEYARFHHGITIPGRYFEAYWSHSSNDQSIFLAPNHNHGHVQPGFYAHVGLAVFVGALSKSAMCPRSLHLAVGLDEDYALISLLLEDVFRLASRNVRALELSNEYWPFWDTDGHEDAPRISITKSTFPVLESLTLHNHGNDVDKLVTPLPPMAEIPTLKHLNISGITLDTSTTLAFIQHYGRDLESLVLQGEVNEIYSDLLQIIDQLKPKHLTIEVRSDIFWNSYLLGENDRPHYIAREIMAQFPKALVQGLAKSISLRPTGFERALNEYWNA